MDDAKDAIEKIAGLLGQSVGQGVAQPAEGAHAPAALWVAAEKIADVCHVLHTHESTYFDMLSCLTGIDNGPEAGTMEVVYNLYSIPFHTHLMLKASLPRSTAGEPGPSIPTVSHIWRTADWHEREAFDLLGIRFEGHPDLRRILLPADWQGHPLRKDYQHQAYYRGIKVAYESDGDT